MGIHNLIGDAFRRQQLFQLGLIGGVGPLDLLLRLLLHSVLNVGDSRLIIVGRLQPLVGEEK